MISIAGAGSDGSGGFTFMATQFGQESCFAGRYDGDGNLLWSTAIAASTTGQFAGVVIHDAV